MLKTQRDVTDFHHALNHPIGATQQIPPRVELRAKLIAEEAAETIAALGFDVDLVIRNHDTGRNVADFWKDGEESLPELVDGICDTIVVLMGTAIEAGVDVEPYWDEVHATNMAKAGGPRRADGKSLKPAGWKPPAIAAMLDAGRGALCYAGCGRPIEPRSLYCADETCVIVPVEEAS